jgi:hypothetical protein
MGTIDIPRDKIIRRALMQNPDRIVDTTIALWERLAIELIAIIGEGGFASIYSRSVHLVSADFPWLAPCRSAQQNDTRFASLRMSLEARGAGEAHEASITLLNAFIGILDTLIGVLLTRSLLRSAWGDDSMEIPEKEI